MKPVHIGLLIAAAALGGAMFVKFTQGPQNAPPAPAVTETPVPATPVPQAEPPAANASAVEEKVEEKKAEAPKPSKKTSAAKTAEPKESRPAKTEVAQNKPAPPPQTAPEPAPAPTPAPDTQKEARSPIFKPESEQTAPSPPPPRKVTLAAGTLLQVRLVEGLSTERNQAGDTFAATLDAPLVVDGLVIAERGARLEGRVVEAEKAGRVRGVSSLAVELTRLTTSDGQHVRIQTDSFTKEGEKSLGKDAAKVGVAAGIGAAIGAIAGGGKGAGIGAAIGGAAGTGGVLATRGTPATLSSETRITFRLREPVTITERQSQR